MTVHASTKHGRKLRYRPENGYRRWLANERAGRETRNPFCAGTNRWTRPCQHRAMNGGAYCYGHDPARSGADPRAHGGDASPVAAERPAEPTAAGEIQAELAAYFEASGPLGRAHGGDRLLEQPARPLGALPARPADAAGDGRAAASRPRPGPRARACRLTKGGKR